MNENSTLYFYLIVMILGIVLIVKGLRDQYLENKKKAATDAAESDKQRIDNLVSAFSSLLGKMSADNEKCTVLAYQVTRLKNLVNELENRQKELEDSNRVLSDVNTELKRSNTTLINKAKDLREDIRQREEAIKDMENYVDSIESIKLGLEIAVNSIDAEEIPFLSRAITSLGVTPSVRERLAKEGILYIGELIYLSEDYLMDIWGVGPVTIDKIKNKLNENGVWFGMDVIRINDRWYRRKSTNNVLNYGRE